jgi:uncharacterized protein YjbJ (UPF0337 family)
MLTVMCNAFPLVIADLYSINKIKLTMKDLTEIKGDWLTIKRKLKEKFVMLTDSDLLSIEGKQDEMLGRLQERLGKTKEEMHKLISEL